jgi:hypothetical protein
MKPHKWAKEIKAWADGSEIEGRNVYEHGYGDWHILHDPTFSSNGVEYRIKPQPKEPQYLYVYQGIGELVLEKSNTLVLDMKLIGKIKLEVDDAN